MGYVHSARALDLLIALWHDHESDRGHGTIPVTAPPCHICKPLHVLLGWSWEEYKRWVEESVQPVRKENTIGTRGLIGVIVDGVAKTSYNHFDSYPEALGVSTVVPLRLYAEGGGSWQDLSDLSRAVRMIDERGPAPTDVDKEKLAEFLDTRVAGGSADDWYCLTRNLQGKLLQMLSVGYMVDAEDFALDSLFCEWGYVIDFDKGAFQVYKGFQHAPHNEGFWGGREASQRATGDYYPIRLVKEWPLIELPTKEQFLSELAEPDTE